MIKVHVHYSEQLGSKPIEVNPDDELNVLTKHFPHDDFYLHGELLDLKRTFKQCGIGDNSRLQTYCVGGYPGSIPLLFQFHRDNNCIRMDVPLIWSFRRAAM